MWPQVVKNKTSDVLWTLYTRHSLLASISKQQPLCKYCDEMVSVWMEWCQLSCSSTRYTAASFNNRFVVQSRRIFDCHAVVVIHQSKTENWTIIIARSYHWRLAANCVLSTFCFLTLKFLIGTVQCAPPLMSPVFTRSRSRLRHEMDIIFWHYDGLTLTRS